MKLIHESTSCLLHLLLLAELLGRSSCRPTTSPYLCPTFRSMSHHLDRLMNSSKKLHDLTEEELLNFAAVDHRLDSFPQMNQTPADLRTLQVNQSLSQLYLHTQTFRLHIDLLRTAKENVSVSSQPVEGASLHLRKLSHLLQTSLQQMNEDVPQTPTPSLPVVSKAFDALVFSVEMSERLHVFCDWSKRVLRHIQGQSRCPRH